MDSVNHTIAKQRKYLSVADKVRVIREIESGRKKTDVCREFNLVYQTVLKFWKNREKIMDKYDKIQNDRQAPSTKYLPSGIGEELLAWLDRQRFQGGELSDTLLKARAEEFAAVLGYRDFVCTDGWLEDFKNRHHEYFREGQECYSDEDGIDASGTVEDLGYFKQKSEGEESSSDDESILRCLDCEVSFTSKYYLNQHLLHHIKQPHVSVTRVQVVPKPIRITLKNRNNSFEIVSSPQSSSKIADQEESAQVAETATDAVQDDVHRDEEEIPSATIEEIEDGDDEPPTKGRVADDKITTADTESAAVEVDEPANVSFSPNYICGDAGEIDSGADEATNDEILDDADEERPAPGDKTSDFNSSVPDAETTPPPEPSPDYPKIRIKTGLLKESLTITEITDGNSSIDFNPSSNFSNLDSYNSWATPSLEDPLRLDGHENDSSILSNLFSTNNDRAKDLGFTTSDTEFISLDNTRASNALQVYNSANSMVSSNPLDTLTNLPMQQLAQQVSRLQPNGNNGMHQQNVLINIQQFPQAPQPHGYQPHMYAPHPPQPMYHQPYQYQPPNPIYYPPAPPAYPPHMQPPRPQMPPQMPPPGQQIGHQQTLTNGQQTQYRPRQQQPLGPRQQQQTVVQQQQQNGPRGVMQPRGMQQMGPRQFAVRQPMGPRGQRAPMIGRGRSGPMMGTRGPRPRNPMQNGGHTQLQQHLQPNGPRLIKRPPDAMQHAMLAKRKKMDVLVPDKHDDADCQVIAVQPKNTGLPQIQSIQGNAPEPADSSIMHLSDSITLSVRNPPPKPASPKKSDAKDVANILATRGITVTATPKGKEAKAISKSPEPAVPVAINLNSSVCIIPTNKNIGKPDKLTTVDLTDDTVEQQAPVQKPLLPKQQQQQNKVLPFQCDLCPAKYPNSLSLNKHRQSFHKTGSMCDYGVPLIDLKTPGVVQRLASLGIHNYIPLPGANSDSTFALPIINTNTYKNGNLNSIGATSVLTLGPVRMFPRPPQGK